MLNGRYDRQQLLGDGGMGQVWRAVDNRLGRTVAVKMPLPRLVRDPVYLERFNREARAMAGLHHPNVIQIHDVADSPEGPFIVMEFVDGVSLSELLQRRGRLTPYETMNIVAQAAMALEEAHRHSVVHRDVKPGNLLIRRENRSVVLTDFGIAQTPTENMLTGPSHVIGTPTYMAPEIIRGNSASPSSDIYSLGVVAYECLAGHAPFTGKDPIAVAAMHANNPPKPLPSDIPPAVRQLVMRSLAKRPRDRHATAAEFRKDAKNILRGLQKVAPTINDRVEASPRPRRRRLIVLALLATMALGAGGAYTYINNKDLVAGSVVPQDMRAFAPNWPYDKCVENETPGDMQNERWECDLESQVQLYLIRYQTDLLRDAKWQQTSGLRPGPGRRADWKHGTAAAPHGHIGRYVEFEVDIVGSEGGWHESIWWDNGPGKPSAPFALILRTKSIPNAQLALDRLRAIWASAKYGSPR